VTKARSTGIASWSERSEDERASFASETVRTPAPDVACATTDGRLRRRTIIGPNGRAWPIRSSTSSVPLYPTVVLAKLVMEVAKGAAAFGSPPGGATGTPASPALRRSPSSRASTVQRKVSLLHQVPGRRREAIAGQGAIWRDHRVGSPLDSRIASLLK